MSQPLLITAKYTGAVAPTATLELSFDARQKSRFRGRLTDGREVGVVLPRGKSLHHGDLLAVEDGTVVVVHAKSESVSRVLTSDLLLLSRAAYHLGNRHMAVQILPGELRYHHDYVLDDMLRRLGLEPTLDDLPFEPESGAYGSGHSFASHPHYHGHDHSHGEHSHGDEHDHSHDHSAHDHSHGHELKHPYVQQQPKSRPPGDLRVASSSPHRTGVIHTNWNDDESSGSSQ
jgi:urease accessory protein